MNTGESIDRRARIFDAMWMFLAWLQKYVEVVRGLSPMKETDAARTMLISMLSEYLQPFLRADVTFIGHRDLEPTPADYVRIVKESVRTDRSAHGGSALLNHMISLNWRFPVKDLSVIQAGKPVMLFDQGLQKLPQVFEGLLTALAAEVVSLSGREYYLFFCDVDDRERDYLRYDNFDKTMLSVATGILEIGFQSGMRRGKRLEEEETGKFMTDLVHELKTPVQGILANASNLYSEIPDSLPELRQMASSNVSASYHLGLLIDTLLLTMDHLPPDTEQPVEMSLSSVLQEAVDMFRGEAQLRGIEIREPSTISGQPFPRLPMYFRELVIAFKNLLHNAIVYSVPRASGEYGPIQIVGYGTDEGYYVVDVVNYGFEILPEEIEQERLFKRSYRGAQAMRMVAAGSGLGLSSVQRAVHRHRGEIKVRSEQADSGLYLNTFSIRLPLTEKRARYEPDSVGR